jgi:hypothetical protein
MEGTMSTRMHCLWWHSKLFRLAFHPSFGPTAQISVALGSILADLLRVSDEERRVLVLAAMAAGLAAVFRSPLGMAIFAVEILYRNQLLTNPETSPVLFLCYQSSTVGPRSSTTRAAWSRLFSLMLVLETSGQAASSIR